jgi:hypothetical protein
VATGFLWEQLRLWVGQGLVACARAGPDETAVYDGGVRRRRAYTVMDARQVLGRHRLIRLRAHFPRVEDAEGGPGPGGVADGAGEGAARRWPAEWAGRWCSGGPEWAQHPEVAAALGVASEGGHAATDGAGASGCEFWMEFGDWAGVFDSAWVCQLFPASWAAPRSTYPDADPLVAEGRWSRDSRQPLCGGGPEQASWWANPQFRLVLPGRTQVYLTLTQEDRRYRPRPNRLNGQAPFEKRFVPGGADGHGAADAEHARDARAGQGPAGPWEYRHAIGMVVVRRAALEAARAGTPLRRADMELATSSFRRGRDVGIYSVTPDTPSEFMTRRPSL